MQVAAGAGGDKVYVDDIFSTTVWIGNGNNNRDIVNGIDISTEGGMVWIKRRNENRDHSLFDTIRGVKKMLSINNNTSEDTEGNTLTQFNTNGFRLNDDNYVNSNNNTYCSWTFRKCPKFFSMATWSGNSTSGRQIAHDLGVVPGVIIVKCYSSNGHAHAMYHRKAHNSQPERCFIPVDTGTGATLFQHAWNNTAPTSTHFTLGNNPDFNGSGKDYVAWIFAHNNSDGEFGGQSGADGDVIKCDSYTGNGSSTNSVNVGFEPQFIMLHKRDGGYENAPIYVFDSIRGIVAGGVDPYVQAAFSSSEVTNANRLKVTATGFTLETSNATVNENGTEYLYTCIRRSDGYVGKPIELGTDAFAMDTGNSSSTIPTYDSGFPVDFALYRTPASPANWWVNARLTQGYELKTNSSDAQGSYYANGAFDSNTGWNKSGANTTHQSWMWKRYAGFDVVTWEGDDTNAFRSHNLGKTPEMIWFKNRDASRSWRVYHKGLNGGTNPEDYAISINSSSAEGSNTAYMNGTAPTSTHFVAGLDGDTNVVGDSYIALLFASVDGVSKLDTYTGTGSSGLSVTTGFQPRFLIIKRSDTGSTHWLVFDSLRGFSSGNDSQLALNTTNAAVTNTNFGEFTSTGFTINETYSEINNNGGNYLYYAHA